mmetsp:Transcript_14356/g.41239  ORF Transcript_14356/g.41239 Transcript_14356/m.41239 type:complete len:205 (-) Transcript_14356:2517-3131(-)
MGRHRHGEHLHTRLEDAVLGRLLLGVAQGSRCEPFGLGVDSRRHLFVHLHDLRPWSGGRQLRGLAEGCHAQVRDVARSRRGHVGQRGGRGLRAGANCQGGLERRRCFRRLRPRRRRGLRRCRRRPGSGGCRQRELRRQRVHGRERGAGGHVCGRLPGALRHRGLAAARLRRRRWRDQGPGAVLHRLHRPEAQVPLTDMVRYRSA